MAINVVLPKIETDVATQKHGRFLISPLERGYGVTLGNALRRVLLSSLPGAAITRMRIEGVHHEFTTIPYAREDVMGLILNVKQVRMRVAPETEGPFRIYAEVRGEGVLTAGDLRTPPEITIVNPEQEILTVDSPEADFDLEFIVEEGRGYSPAQERKTSIGEIPVDAIFSPVRKVEYKVTPTRIGRMTNYDELSLEIWTDGTMKPHAALKESAAILIRHLVLIGGEAAVHVEEEAEAKPSVPSRIPDSVYNEPVEHLGLSMRAFNALKRSNLLAVGPVLERMAEGRKAMTSIRNFGDKSLEELVNQLKEKDYLKYVPRDALDDMGIVVEEEKKA